MKTGTSRKVSLKEDTKHVLEELWEAEEEESFYKIFTRECVNKKGCRKLCDTLKHGFRRSHTEMNAMLSTTSKRMK